MIFNIDLFSVLFQTIKARHNQCGHIFFASAMIAICSINLSLPILLSIYCGAIYLPFEVFINSLIRSVINKFPCSSNSPASPVLRNHLCEGLSRFFWLLVIAFHYHFATHEDFIIFPNFNFRFWHECAD